MVTNPVPYQSETPYASFTLMTTKGEEPHNSVVNLLTTGLGDYLQAIGLKKDSLDPELLFIIRSETHLIGRHSSVSSKEVLQTHTITNPVNSPYENTSGRLKSKSSGGKIRCYDKESFYRIQAIDAIKNELVWSVKIYPHKTKGLHAESIPQIIRDLIGSFSQVQFNYSKIRK